MLSVVPHTVDPHTVFRSIGVFPWCPALCNQYRMTPQIEKKHCIHPTQGAPDYAHANVRTGLPPNQPWAVAIPAKITIPKHQLVFLRTQPLRIIFSLLRECLLSFQERTPMNLSNLLLGASQTTIPEK